MFICAITFSAWHVPRYYDAQCPGTGSCTCRAGRIPGTPIRTPYWRNRPTCGINALYAFLRLCDVDVTYAALERNIRIGDVGSSVRDMRVYAVQAGINAAVVKAAPKICNRLRNHSSRIWRWRACGFSIQTVEVTTSSLLQQLRPRCATSMERPAVSIRCPSMRSFANGRVCCLYDRNIAGCQRGFWEPGSWQHACP